MVSHRVHGNDDVYALNCFLGTGLATFSNRDLPTVAKDSALNAMLTAKTTQASVGGCESRRCGERSMIADPLSSHPVSRDATIARKCDEPRCLPAGTLGASRSRLVLAVEAYQAPIDAVSVHPVAPIRGKVKISAEVDEYQRC